MSFFTYQGPPTLADLAWKTWLDDWTFWTRLSEAMSFRPLIIVCYEVLTAYGLVTLHGIPQGARA